MWELCWVTQEEYWCVVGNNIPVAILGAKFDRKASRIAGAVVGPGLSTNGREAHRNRAFLSLLREDVGRSHARYGVRAFKVPVCTTSLCVDDPLRDPLAVEVGEQVDEMEILQQKRAVLTDSLSLVRVRHRGTVGGGIKCIFGSHPTILLVRRELGGDMTSEAGIC